MCTVSISVYLFQVSAAERVSSYCIFIIILYYTCSDCCLSMCFDGRNERVHIKLPLNIEEAKNLGRVLDAYKEQFYVEVLSTFVFAYILYPFLSFFLYLYEMLSNYSTSVIYLQIA